MSNRSRFGKAPSTDVVNESAKRISRAFRLIELRLQVEEMTTEEFASDNLAQYFCHFCEFLSTRSIPCHADSELQPTSRSNGSCLTTATLLIYIGQHFADVRKLVPDHLDFKNIGDQDSPSWYTKLRSAFQTASDRYQQLSGGEARFGAVKIRPLYQENHSNTTASVDDNDIDDFISAIDLKYIFRKLVMDADLGCFEKKSMVGYQCLCGRTGWRDQVSIVLTLVLGPILESYEHTVDGSQDYWIILHANGSRCKVSV